MSAPYFSVIVPCLNAAATLARTIQSVADQTESDRELIVVDGGSTDGTLEIIRARSDVIAHSVSERDSGVYAAMNKGTRLASGRWLLFLGANDSLIHPDVLLKVRTAIGDDRDAIYCGEAEYHDGRVWHAPLRPRVAYGNFMHHQSTFYHRSLFERGGYDETLRIQSDYEFNLRQWRAGTRIVPLAVRISSCACGGLSDGGLWQNYREEMRVRHRHFAAWKCWMWDCGSIARYLRKKVVRAF